MCALKGLGYDKCMRIWNGKNIGTFCRLVSYNPLNPEIGPLR